MGKYQPKDSFQSPRFCGPRTFMRLPFVEQIDEHMDFIITGIPFDSGQSFRTGARFGPEAIRDFSILLIMFQVLTMGIFQWFQVILQKPMKKLKKG
jgi:agmatinase